MLLSISNTQLCTIYGCNDAGFEHLVRSRRRLARVPLSFRGGGPKGGAKVLQ